MSDLIVSSTVLAQNIPKEDESIHERLNQINLSKEKVAASIRHITDRIGKMFNTLNANTRDLREEMVRVRQEILRLEQERRQAILKEAPASAPYDDLDSEFDEFDSGRAQFESQFEFINDEQPEKEDATLVKMFRIIAGKTHPDKTDDPELHALFIQAKEFRRVGDLDGIKNIYNYVTGKASRLVDALMKRVESALADLRYLETQLDAVRRSEDYILLSLFERDPENVKSMSRLQFSTHLRALQSQLADLQKLAGVGKSDPFGINFERG